MRSAPVHGHRGDFLFRQKWADLSVDAADEMSRKTVDDRDPDTGIGQNTCGMAIPQFHCRVVGNAGFDEGGADQSTDIAVYADQFVALKIGWRNRCAVTQRVRIGQNTHQGPHLRC